jgi:hypothetical protein
MEMVITQQRTENREYVRRLLRQKQPGFSAALELAVLLVDRQLRPPDMLRHIRDDEPHDQ